jgi:hypothetical protein
MLRCSLLGALHPGIFERFYGRSFRRLLMENAAKSAYLDGDLARRLHRALTAGKEELFLVLDDPSGEVLHAALKNPHLDDNHLLALLKRRDLAEDLLKSVARMQAVAESHPLKLALVKNPATPGPVVQTLLPHLYLFELVGICSLPGVTADQRLAAERAIIQRLPTTPLGNKLTLARRGTSAVVEALLKAGDPRFAEACLDNPRLTEAAVFQFLSGPAANAETISAVARHPRFRNRPNLQLAILRNPKAPAVWFTLYLPHLGSHDLHDLLASRRLAPTQKKMVTDELKRRGQR